VSYPHRHLFTADADKFAGELGRRHAARAPAGPSPLRRLAFPRGDLAGPTARRPPGVRGEL